MTTAIRPVMETQGVRVYHGAWEDVLPSLTGEPIAAVVTDPPYGIQYNPTGGDGAGLRSNLSRIAGDDQPFDPSPLLKLAPIVSLCGANHYAHLLPPSSRWLVWDKREGVKSNDMADCELIWTNLEGPARLFSHMWMGMLRASERRQPRVHPTQKPIALMVWIIAQLGLPVDALVLDPYAGSGTTALACLKAGLRCILIEKDARYIPTIIRRLKAAETPLLASQLRPADRPMLAGFTEATP